MTIAPSHRVGVPSLALVVAWSACPGAGAAQQDAGPDPEPTYELDTLRVDVASRAAGELGSLTRSVEVVTRDEIRSTPARDVADLLHWLTGVEPRPRSAAQADLSIRGSSFEQVLVLVDGVRMNDPQTGHFTMDLTVPLEEIERIEVVRGPASSLHGADAVGGVVNIVTSRGRGREEGGVELDEARLEGGGFGQAGAALTARGRAGGVDVSGGAEFRRSDGHRPGTDSRVAKATLRAGGAMGSGRLSTDVGFALRDFGANGFYSSFDSYEETRTLTASARWTPREDDGGVTLEPRASFRLHDDDFVLVRGDPAFFRNLHTSWQVGTELVARAPLSGAVDLAGGMELYRDELESNNLGDRDETRGAAFLELTAGRTGEAVVQAGIRSDWHEGYGPEASPSASLAVWPASGLKLRGSVGRSFRTPSWIERFLDSPANVGQPGLRPETAWSGELGAEMELGRGARFEATAFLREARDLIDFARPEGAGDEVPWQARNVESATFTGLEFAARAPGPAGVRLVGALELLSLEAEADAGFMSKRALRPLAEKLHLQASRRLGPRLSVALRGLRARRRGEGDPYYRLDGRVAYELGAARLYLEGTNLTDDDYPDITGHRAPGRSLVAGLTWDGAGR